MIRLSHKVFIYALRVLGFVIILGALVDRTTGAASPANGARKK